MTAAGRRRFTVAPESRPALARHVQLRFDATRRRWVLLVPERVLAPDPVAVEILGLCDGARSVDDVVRTLAGKYDAPRARIEADVLALLQDLAGRGFLVDRRPAVEGGSR
jgi:pyrroloquinoline quinone biosynthesis protein D